MQSPNVLLIILDTLRRDHLSPYGYLRDTAPNLAHFASEATQFEYAVSPAQWTIPAHASLFSGHYASVHGVTEGSHSLRGEHPTLAEILRVGGYRTIGFSNNPLVGLIDNGFSRGFDHFYNYSGASPNRPVDAKRPAVQRAINRQTRQMVHHIQQQFARSNWLFRVSMSPMLTPLWTRLINYKGHTERSLQDASETIRAHHGQPLFTFINLMGAHLPYRPPQSALDSVAPHLKHDRRAYEFVRHFNAEGAKWASPPDPQLTAWQQRALLDFYDAEVRHQDELLGKFLHGLDSHGILDNTLVIIMADHGEGHGDHQFLGHGFVVYQELVHVPLLIRFPNREGAGQKVSTPISTRRIFHTMLDFAQLTPPLDEADPNAQVGALSLRSTLADAVDIEGQTPFAEAFPPHTFLHVLEHRNPTLIDRLRLRQVRRAVYHQGNKLAMVGDQVEGFYHVQQDPFEHVNLATDAPNQVAHLHGLLTRFTQQQATQRAQAHLPVDDPAIVDQLRALGYLE